MGPQSSVTVIAVCSAVMLCAGCGFNVIAGSGRIVAESRAVSGFDSVSFAGSGVVTITQGEEEALKIEADDNIMPHIRTRVENGRLTVDYDTRDQISPSKPIQFALSVKTIKALDLAGSWTVQSAKIKADRLAVQTSGSGRVKLDGLQAGELVVVISGAGDFGLAGQVSSQKVTIAGSGKYAAGDLKSQKAKVSISGSGDATLWAGDSLDVSIGGSGKVGYFGTPRITQSIAGAGALKCLGNK